MSGTVNGTPHASPPVLAAYSYCEAVTGQQAGNFSYGIRLLPTAKRRAMSALYAFSRRVDDIGDGPLDAESKRLRLEEARTTLDRIRQGDIDEDDTDPVAVALAHAVRRFPIPLGGLDELIDGVQMDVRGETYETWDELRAYCRCVAGAIGRLSLGVFGTVPGARDAARAAEYADTLGLALQLTNILRDVREDAANGRTYLPAEDLAKFGCSAGFHSARPPGRGGLHRAGPLRGAARPRPLRRGHPAAAHARPPQWRLRGRHVRHLPQAAGPHRRGAAGRAARQGLAARPGKGLRRRPWTVGVRRAQRPPADRQGARLMARSHTGKRCATLHPVGTSLTAAEEVSA
ncbi:hypothetical protein GCM10020000_14430 [Streptomyces olivoverticillatus]